MVPCALVSWCVGHVEDEWLSPDQLIHVGEAQDVIEFDPTARDPRPEDLVIERQLVVGQADEFYFMYGNLNVSVDVDELEALAVKFDRAAATIRQLAQSEEVQNARRLHNG
jgi:hypothetical protein